MEGNPFCDDIPNVSRYTSRAFTAKVALSFVAQVHLLEIINDANVLLQRLLRLEDNAAAVGGNIDLVPRERVVVKRIVEKRDRTGGAGQS